MKVAMTAARRSEARGMLNYASGIIKFMEGADIEAALLRSQIAVEAMLAYAVEMKFKEPQYFNRLGLTAYRKVQSP
jgi:preprotein translocase subunit Sec61beta